MLKQMSIVVLALTALASGVRAAEPPAGWSEPTVAHEGVRVMRAGGETIESAYRYLPPGKHRQEMVHEGMSVTMILRHDLGVAWMLLPMGNMYMETPIDSVAAEGPTAPSAQHVKEFREVGKEEIDGWPTTRYHVVTVQDGERAEGDFWVTEHWIPIRIEISADRAPSKAVTMELKDLKLQPQDPALFELPPGATGIRAPFGR